MPYMALEKRGDKGIEVEAETKEERISFDGDTLEILGWIDDDHIIRVVLELEDLPEKARRRIAEEEIKKAAELLNVVRVAIEGEED